MILFDILKLFGLDIPAKIEAVKANLELRVEQATNQVKQVAQEAAVIAAFSAIATITGAMAVGVGLIALYRWAADAYGAYAGLGVVGAILVTVTVIFATAATIKGKSLAANRIKLTSVPGVMSTFVADAEATEPHSTASPIASASDLMEPFAFFLSKFVKYPSIGNPAVDELIGNLRATAHGTADEAIACAAKVIRHGDRTNLIVVLTRAAFVGWLVTHHSHQ